MFLAFLVEDPVRDTVVKALASYTGIAALVVALVGGLKLMFKEKIDGKEPLLALGLTFVIGAVAKLVLPAIYGENRLDSWALHTIVLLVVAVVAKGLHDGPLSALKGKEKSDE